MTLMQQVKQNKKPTSERSWDSARATVSDRVMNLGQNRCQDASSSPSTSPTMHSSANITPELARQFAFCLFHHNQMGVAGPSGPHCLKLSFSVFLCTWPLQDASFFFFALKKNQLIYFWLLWVVVAARGLSLVAGAGAALY